MAYSHTWDETFPPDTQLAKLLGKDIRDFKTDVRERMLISGLESNRANPESSFVGLLYFATDTHKVWRWNGTSWDDVTALIVPPLPVGTMADYFNYTPYSLAVGAALQDTVVVSTIPSLLVGSTLEIDFMMSQGIEGPLVDFDLQINSASFVSLSTVLAASWTGVWVNSKLFILDPITTMKIVSEVRFKDHPELDRIYVDHRPVSVASGSVIVKARGKGNGFSATALSFANNVATCVVVAGSQLQTGDRVVVNINFLVNGNVVLYSDIVILTSVNGSTLTWAAPGVADGVRAGVSGYVAKLGAIVTHDLLNVRVRG